MSNISLCYKMSIFLKLYCNISHVTSRVYFYSITVNFPHHISNTYPVIFLKRMTFNFLLLTQVYIHVDHLQVCHTRSTLRRTNTPPLLFTSARILPSGAPEKNPKLSRRGDRTSVKEERNDCATSQTVSSCIIALSSFSVILNH